MARRAGNAAAMLMLNATRPETIKLARAAMVGVGFKAQRLAAGLLERVARRQTAAPPATVGTAPLRDSPSLRRGDRIRVRTGDTVYVYEVRRTRWTSFRQPASLRAQRAEVPGRPGETATRAMITLSTCATLEDHANGNYWSDEFDNPEHRIDKIGVLVATRPA